MKNTLFAALIIALTPFAAHADTAAFSVRDGATLLGPWTVTLPDASTSPLAVTPNEGTTTPVDLSAGSVLGALESLAAAHGDFSISDLKYFDFGTPYASGLYLNCLVISAASSTPRCDNWQFSVNGAALSQGAGVTTLTNGDSVFLYYGSPRSVSLSSATVTAGTPFTATAQTYNPADNTFAPVTGVTIGVTQPDPNNPWSPIEVATSSADGSGQATFTLPAAGSYNVGIQEDYYSPATALTVVAAAPAPAAFVAGGAGGGGSVAHAQVNVEQALSYLVSQQNSDGSFGSPLLSDWAALAFAAAGPDSAEAALRQYLATASPALGSVTDYERHAMALEALGINPYSGSPTDVITPIAKAFDGTQVGDPSLDTDDIFALLPLLHAGYTANDTLIQKTSAFILSRQAPSGAWDASPDVTAAAVQTLTPVRSLPNVEAALAQAETFLHSQQQSNGGFGNSFTTSWVLQAIAALGEPGTSWVVPAGSSGTDYLAGLEQSDGGIEPSSSSVQTRVWATEYAIPAALGKAWPALLQSFAKPAANAGTGASAASPLPAATATPVLPATTTLPVATSTPPTEPVSTSTPRIATTTAPAAAVVPAPSAPPRISLAPRPAAPVKAVSEPKLPVLADRQAAAVAGAPTSGLLIHVWDAVAAFFSRFL